MTSLDARARLIRDIDRVRFGMFVLACLTLCGVILAAIVAVRA